MAKVKGELGDRRSQSVKNKKRCFQTKKDLKKSLVTKYPKSGINGLWEERIQMNPPTSLFP